jgi:hypothetical protein
MKFKRPHEPIAGFMSRTIEVLVLTVRCCNRLSGGGGSWPFVFVDFKSHHLLLGGFSVSHPQLQEWLPLVA